MELAVPIEMLPVNEQGTFYMNVVRKVEGLLTWWRGEVQTYSEPVVYETFRF